MLETLQGPGSFSESDMPFVQTIADLIALEIDRVRLDAEATAIRESQEAGRLRAEVMATFSHELRTPLTSILAFADVLSKDKPGTLVEKQQHQLGIIQRNGRRLKMLIDELLDTTLRGTENISIDPSEFDIVETAVEVTQALTPITDEKRQHVEVTTTDETITLEGDQFRVS